MALCKARCALAASSWAFLLMYQHLRAALSGFFKCVNKSLMQSRKTSRCSSWYIDPKLWLFCDRAFRGTRVPSGVACFSVFVRIIFSIGLSWIVCRSWKGQIIGPGDSSSVLTKIKMQKGIGNTVVYTRYMQDSEVVWAVNEDVNSRFYDVIVCRSAL